MRFEIINDGFEKRGDITPYGTLPLRSKGNGRDFFLNAPAAVLLDLSSGEHDFEAEFGGLPPEKQQELRDGLTLLSAFGAAKLQKESAESAFCRVAGEKDYKAVSALVNSDSVTRMGKMPRDPEYMSQDSIRARQFNNDEYNFLYWENGALKGVLLACIPSSKTYSVAFRLCGIVVSEDADAAETAGKLIDYTISEFQEEFRICRYLCFEEEDRLVPILLAHGFAQTAHLLKEAEDGGDVTIYDKRFITC